MSGAAADENFGDDRDRSFWRRIFAAVAIDAAQHAKQQFGGDAGVEVGPYRAVRNSAQQNITDKGSESLALGVV
jgi:hypothetical protein